MNEYIYDKIMKIDYIFRPDNYKIHHADLEKEITIIIEDTKKRCAEAVCKHCQQHSPEMMERFECWDGNHCDVVKAIMEVE